MPKKSKYDTDPLDPDVAVRADEQWASETTAVRPQPAPSGQAPRREFADTEGPTRRFDQQGYTAYHSVFDEQNAPPAPVVQTPPGVSSPPDIPTKVLQPPTSRVVPGMNLAENITLILPYIPFYIGAVAAIIELFLIPRSESRARFHASQGLALHIVAIVISSVLGFLSSFSSARIGGIAFSIATTVLFIIAMVRTWKGEPVHVAPADDLSAWLNEKISPRK